MPTDDRNEAHDLALDAYWEGVLHGERVSPSHLGPTFTATVRRLHARDATPGPDAAFVRRLWSDLMQTTALGEQALIPSHATPSLNGHAPRLAASVPTPEPVRMPRTRPFAAFATAAILLLTLVSGYGAYRLATPGTGGVPPALMGSQGGTPIADACTMPPRSRPVPSSGTPAASLDSVFRVRATTAGAMFDQIIHIDELPAGAAAGEAPIDGIRTTLAQVAPCHLPGNAARWIALFSDDFFRRSGGSACPPRCLDGVALPPWMELARTLTVHDARVLADGRVGAIVESPPLVPMFVVFVEQDGWWLIDEIAYIEQSPVDICVLDGDYGTPTAIDLNEVGTPGSAYGGRIYIGIGEVNIPERGNIVIGDAGPCASPTAGVDNEVAVYFGDVITSADLSEADVTQEITIVTDSRSFSPSALTVPADSPLSLTIENHTDELVAFVIDELGIDLQLRAGEVRGVTFTPPPVVYAYYSDLPGQRDAGMSGTLTVV